MNNIISGIEWFVDLGPTVVLPVLILYLVWY